MSGEIAVTFVLFSSILIKLWTNYLWGASFNKLQIPVLFADLVSSDLLYNSILHDRSTKRRIALHSVCSRHDTDMSCSAIHWALNRDGRAQSSGELWHLNVTYSCSPSHTFWILWFFFQHVLLPTNFPEPSSDWPFFLPLSTTPVLSFSCCLSFLRYLLYANIFLSQH